MLVPVILSGGIGSRLWPESRRTQPKQLSRLTGPTSLLQMTAQRATAIPSAEPPVVVCGAVHRDAINQQLREIGIQPQPMILEPFGRSTAPAAAAAALLVDADDLLLVLPADHLILDVTEFAARVQLAARVADAGYLVTFGITPTGPETGFGYIERSEALPGFGDAYRVEQFVEKPDRDTAERYVAAGTFSWNSGMFLFRAGIYLEELQQHAPGIAVATRAAVERGTRQDSTVWLDPASFDPCPEDSIDYAVMEKTDRAAVVPLDAGWNDVGSWAALWEVSQKDEAGNVVIGPAYLYDTTNSLVRGRDRTVAVIGMDGVVVVDTADAVLVVNRDRSQDVKQVVQRLEAEGSPVVERHPE